MKKFGIVFAICVVIALGVLCFLIINSEDPYLNTNKVISNNISPAHSSDVVENTPSPTALKIPPAAAVLPASSYALSPVLYP